MQKPVAPPSVAGIEPTSQHALITGGAGALATAVAAALTDAGLTVHAPPRAALDVRDSGAVSTYIAALPRLDLLVNAAGLVVDKPLARMSPQDWGTVVDTNLTGAFHTARAAARPMAKQRGGHIVNIGSYSALSGPAGQANYAAAKAGLHALTQSLAAELGPRNVRANTVLPGFMDTKITTAVTPERRGAVLAQHSLGRFNTPGAVAAFITHLHLHLPHTSGQLFNLDSRPVGTS